MEDATKQMMMNGTTKQPLNKLFNGAPLLVSSEALLAEHLVISLAFRTWPPRGFKRSRGRGGWGQRGGGRSILPIVASSMEGSLPQNVAPNGREASVIIREPWRRPRTQTQMPVALAASLREGRGTEKRERKRNGKTVVA